MHNHEPLPKIVLSGLGHPGETSYDKWRVPTERRLTLNFKTQQAVADNGATIGRCWQENNRYCYMSFTNRGDEQLIQLVSDDIGRFQWELAGVYACKVTVQEYANG